MDDKAFRSILSVYRPGESETRDARFEEAKAAAQADPRLSQWWSEEQALDQIIAGKLQSTHVPAGLLMRLTKPVQPATGQRASWSHGIGLAAAAVILLATIFAWRRSFPPAASLADYRDEMVSFVKVDPTLEMKSNQLSEVMHWLGKSHAPSGFDVPQKVQNMESVGCRVLRFHGHDVTLVCFRSGDGKLLHLFVMDRAALPHLPQKERADFSSQGEWTTASWVEGEHAYLMTVQGDRTALERFLTNT